MPVSSLTVVLSSAFAHVRARDASRGRVAERRRRPDVETIFVLLPLALLIAAIAVGFFIWAARTGQFDDLDTPAVRILFDDEEPRRAATRSSRRRTVDIAADGRDSTRRVLR